jgi:hypothetical protein
VVAEAVAAVVKFVEENGFRTLNVAGPRASGWVVGYALALALSGEFRAMAGVPERAGSVMAGWRRSVSIVIASAMGLWFFGGMWLYPDAPLHACVEHGYCGKQGQPHSQREFEHFRVWETGLQWAWPIGIIALFVLNKDRIRMRGQNQ